MSSVRVRLTQLFVQSTLGVRESALDLHTKRFEARGADGNEERGPGLDPSRQVREPGRNEIGTGQLRVGSGHGRKLRALAGTWQAALLGALRVARRLGSGTTPSVGVGGMVRRAPPAVPGPALGALGSALLLLVAGSIAGFRLNLTGSLPVGLYRATPGPLVRGARVLVCLPPRVAAFARARGYVPRGGLCPGGVLPIGKPVFALPGDTVTVTASGLRVNGVPVPNSLALATDHRGRPLPRLAPGPQVVRPGTLWVVSTYASRSFDSRYFGPVAVAAVRSYLRPVWTAAPDR